MTTVSLRTFGCRVNQAEAFAWARAFAAAGLRLEADPARGDVVVVNACTLTGRADRDCRRFLAALRRANPGARVVLTGCLPAGLDPGAARLVVPNGEKDALPGRVADLLAREGLAAREDGAPSGRPWRARGFLKVQEGCDRACAYCVVPGVRGPSRSLPLDDALRRARELAAAGFRELTLAGTHLTAYGSDLSPRVPLERLLSEVEAVEGLWKIRLTSLDPRGVDDALLARLASDPRLCRHFHFSIQHVSDAVLRAMGRPFPPERTLRLLAALRAASPDASLGADLLVGFPGETEGDFAALRDFLEKSPLTYAHVFPFSPRPGTAAAGLPTLPTAVVEARAAELRRASAAKRARFLRTLEGRTLEGIVVRRGTDGRGEVLTDNFVRAVLRRCPGRRGDLAAVRPTGPAERGGVEAEAVAGTAAPAEEARP